MDTQKQELSRAYYAHKKSYRSLDRWSSYWHQINLIRSFNKDDPKKLTSILEIGVGEFVTTDHLRRTGFTVQTLDVSDDLGPDIVGSVTAIPLPDKSVDVVLAAEILEHIPFNEVSLALAEIARVARKGAVISVPHPGYVFSGAIKIPLIRRIECIWKLPFFWKEHAYDPDEIGTHYWELGYKDMPVQRFISQAKAAGLSCKKHIEYQDDPSHIFFTFTV